jgi:hypothetical protein
MRTFTSYIPPDTWVAFIFLTALASTYAAR